MKLEHSASFISGRLALALIVMVIAVHIAGTRAAFADETVDSVVKGLTEFSTDSEEFQAATALAKTLTDEQAGEAAGKMKDKLVGDAIGSAKLILNAYELGQKGGPNPFVKLLGNELAAALKTALDKIAGLFKNPETNTGKLFLNMALEDLGISDDIKRVDIIGKIEEAARARRLQQNESGKQARSSSPESLYFDAATGTLSFSGISIVDVLSPAGLSDPFDTIIGSSISIPDFVFDGINPEGAYGFVNMSDAPLTITSGSNVFLESVVDSLIFEDGKFFGYGGSLVLSGAPLDSPFFGGLPDLGSGYIADLNAHLFPIDLRYTWALTIIPDIDLFAMTAGFSRDARTGFSNTEGLVLVPEPPATLLWGLVTPLVFVLVRWRRQRR
jgi:hypothetical protein